jgi:hypothetical protein
VIRHNQARIRFAYAFPPRLAFRRTPTETVARPLWWLAHGILATVAWPSATTEKALPPGSFYTEPGGVAHFAETKDNPVVVYINGSGPTDTVYVDRGDDHSTK